MFRPLLALAFLLTPLAALAQGGGQYIKEVQKNTVPEQQPRVQDWYKIESPHYQIHFYGQHRELAEMTARYAEQAYQDLLRIANYQVLTRYQIFVYADPITYLQSHHSQYIGEFDEFHINRLVVYYPGNQLDYYRQIKTELSKTIIHELFYGGGLPTSVQTRLLLNVPDWFYTGISYYMGEGWLAQDEAYMRGLDKESYGYVYDIIQKPSHNQYITLKKSIWYFVALQYGERRLLDIIYMTRITRSLENGVGAVLGMNLATLTGLWIEFVNNEFGAEREDIRGDGTPDAFTLAQRDRIASFAASPDGNYNAALIENAGYFSLWMQNLQTGGVSKLPIRFGRKTDRLVFRNVTYPIAWSPDGTELVTTVEQNGLLQLAYYSTITGKVDYYDLSGGLDWINQLDWAKQGDKLVISGTYEGKTDLYILPPRATDLLQITNTPYDELYPAWSHDGRKIYFASNGGNLLGEPGAINYQQSLRPLDLYSMGYPVNRGANVPPSRLTFTEFANEYQVHIAGFTLYFVTDESGLNNLASVNLAENNVDVTYRTNYHTGISFMSITSTGGLLALSPVDGQLQVYNIPNTQLRRNLNNRIVKTRQAAKQYQSFLDELLKKAKELQEAEAEANALFDDSTAVDSTGQDTTAQDSTTTQADSSDAEKPVRFFVFDEEDEPSTTPRADTLITGQNNSRYARTVTERKLIFDINKIETSGLSKPPIGLDLRSVRTTVDIDPLFGYGMAIEGELTDHRLHHYLKGGAKAFFDFASTDFFLNYRFQQYRIQADVSLERSSRRFTRDIWQADLFGDFEAQTYRYSWLNTGLMVSYPINRFARVGLEGSFARIDRRDLTLTDLNNNSSANNVYGVHIKGSFDNTQIEEHYVLRGILAEGSINYHYLQDAGLWSYATFDFDIRKYTNVVADIVLAAQVSGGISLGNHQRERLYMLGGTQDWMNQRFASRDIIPIEGRAENPIFQDDRTEGFYFTDIQEKVRGFDYNERFGTNYLALQTELRIPLARLFTTNLSSRAMYNTQLIAFYDLGVAWNEGNPFNQPDIDVTEQIISPFPVTNLVVNGKRSAYIQSFGAGLRLNLFGSRLGGLAAWGVDDGQIRPVRFIITLGKDF